MVARFWLEEDNRERYYTARQLIDDYMLAKSYGVNENQLEMVVQIGTYPTWLKFGDRPKYIGDVFYEGRLQDMPQAERSMPDILDASISLAESQITIANVDAALTKYLPGGMEYRPFIGDDVSILIGLREIGESLTPIFHGNVSTQNGVQFTKDDITLRFRDRLAMLDNKVPLESITKEAFGSAPTDVIGKLIPLAIGDWEANLSYVENGFTQAQVLNLTYDDVRNYAAGAGSSGGVVGYCIGGGYFLYHTGGRAGKTYYPTAISDVKIKRGDAIMQAQFEHSSSIIGGHYCVFVMGLVRGDYDLPPQYIPYTYQSGDIAIISVKIPIGETWSESDNNPILQAKEILIALGHLDEVEDFSADWTAAANYIAGINYRGRQWIGDGQKTTLGVVSGLLKSFLYDIYIDQSLKISVSPIWCNLWPIPSEVRAHIEQYDIVEDSINVDSEKRNYMTGAQANYGWNAWLNSMVGTTKKRKNLTAETSIGVSSIKEIDLPPVIDESVAIEVLNRYVLLGSAGLIYLEMEVGWKHLLVDLGDFVTISCQLGSIDYTNVPAMVRKIAVLPKVTGVRLTLLVFANFSYPGWTSRSHSANLANYDTMLTDG